MAIVSVRGSCSFLAIAAVLVAAVFASTSAHAQDCTGCAGDRNGDGIVDGSDLGMVLRSWCDTEPCETSGDANEDGVVDGVDLGIVLSMWGACPGGTAPCPLRVVADTDRNGVIENADLAGRAAWTPARGAFYMVNVDDDKKSAGGTSDASEIDANGDLVVIDTKINVNRDASDVTPFLVKPIAAYVAATDEVWLKTANLEQMQAVLFYKKVAQNALVIGGGPAAVNNEFEITPYISKTQNRELGLEGLKYQLKAGGVAGIPADMLFDGFVQLTVELRRAGAVVESDTALLKVAPWIMTPNTLAAEKVFAKDFSVNLPGPAGPVATPNAQFRADLASGLPANTLVVFSTDTQWAQDDIEFGYSQTPRSTMRVAAYSRHHGSSDDPALEAGQPMGDAQWRRDFLMGATPVKRDVGHYRMPRPIGQDSGDYGGNIELLPPTTAHPLGRVCYGSRISDMKRQFFASQEVQPAFEVDTDWLAVGHVDEMISFWKGAPLTVILASPRLAYTTLGFAGGAFPAPPAFAGDGAGGGDGGGDGDLPVPDEAVFFSEGDTDSGYASGGSFNSLVDDTASFIGPTAWKYVRIFDGTGAGQTARIASIADSHTLVIDRVWTGYDYTQPTMISTPDSATTAGTMGFDSVQSSSWITVPDETSRYVVVEDTMWWNAPSGAVAEGPVFPAKTPATLTKKEFNPANAAGLRIRNLNVEVQKRIDDARTKIKAAAGADAVTFVEVPVLYNGSLDALGDLVPESCVAFTPGAANAVIANGKVFVPKQKGPRWKVGGVMTKRFDTLITNALGGAANVVFVEDWDHYHALMGEVHCGTNVLRVPYNFKWWDKQPAGIPSLP